jgi:NhaP-type Na+/H+ or K+/H+ antiporter
VFFVGWAGMRGADSLVIALALPLTAAGQAFPGRNPIIFLTFVVILLTLVAQGSTLQPLIRWLELGGHHDVEREEALARERTGDAGLARLRTLIAERPDLAAAARELEARHRSARTHSRQPPRNDREHALREARAEMIDAERSALVRLRDEGTIGDDVLRRVQHELDLEQMLVGESDQPLMSP